MSIKGKIIELVSQAQNERLLELVYSFAKELLG